MSRLDLLTLDSLSMNPRSPQFVWWEGNANPVAKGARANHEQAFHATNEKKLGQIPYSDRRHENRLRPQLSEFRNHLPGFNSFGTSKREPKNELVMDRPSGTWICPFFSGFGPGASGIYRFHLWRYVVRSLDKVPNRRRHACAIPGLVSRIRVGLQLRQLGQSGTLWRNAKSGRRRTPCRQILPRKSEACLHWHSDSVDSGNPRIPRACPNAKT